MQKLMIIPDITKRKSKKYLTEVLKKNIFEVYEGSA